MNSRRTMGDGYRHYTIDHFLLRLEVADGVNRDAHTEECEQCRLMQALVERVWGEPSEEDSEVLVDWLRARAP